jgi:DNA primase catalytic subunit
MDESIAVNDSQVRQGPSFRPMTAAAHAAADAAAAELMAQEEQAQTQQKRAAAKATAKKAKKQQQKAKAQQQKSLQSPEPLQTSASAAHDAGLELGDTESDSDRDMSPDSAERRTKSMKAKLSAQGLLPPRQQPGTASRPKPAVVDAIRASWGDHNGRVQ